MLLWPGIFHCCEHTLILVNEKKEKERKKETNESWWTAQTEVVVRGGGLKVSTSYVDWKHKNFNRSKPVFAKVR